MIAFMLLCNVLPWRWFCIPAVMYASWGMLLLAGVNDVVWLVVAGEWLSKKSSKITDATQVEIPQPKSVPLNWLEVYCSDKSEVRHEV